VFVNSKGSEVYSMNDYISLERLRAMSGKQLEKRWEFALFPFDVAQCGQCVTQHKYLPGLCSHHDFSEQASRLKVASRARPDELRDNLAEIYALRMFYRDLYPSTPESPATAEVPKVVEEYENVGN
jgi:hypothetical protein